MIWQEPAKGGYPDVGMLGLSGQERHRAGREGRTPYSPMSYVSELRMTAGSQGHSEFEMPASPWFANSAGVIAGILAVIGDACLGSVVHGDLPAGQVMTTAELSMTFLRPALPASGERITGAGQLIHRGRSQGLSEMFLFDPSEALISHGTSRCSVFPPMDPIPDPPDAAGAGRAPARHRPLRSASARAQGRGAPAERVRRAQRHPGPARTAVRGPARAPDPPPDRAADRRGGRGGGDDGPPVQQVALDVGRHGAGRVHRDARRGGAGGRRLQHGSRGHRDGHAGPEGQLRAPGLPRRGGPAGEGPRPAQRPHDRGLVVRAGQLRGQDRGAGHGLDHVPAGRPANLAGVELSVEDPAEGAGDT